MFFRILFVAVIIVVYLLLFVLFLYPPFKRANERKNYKKKTYKVLMDYAEEHDELLINNVTMDLPTLGQEGTFDHALLASKFVYMVFDLHLEGALYGNPADEKLFLMEKDGKVKTVANPIKEALRYTRALSDMVGADRNQHLFVVYVVYDDFLYVPEEFNGQDETIAFVHRKALYRKIKKMEEKDIQTIPLDQTQKVLNLLHEKKEVNVSAKQKLKAR